MTCFSVFLPVRNGMPYIKECVASILGQTHRDFELVILDNQSTDGTVEWLKTLTDPRVRLHFSDRALTIVESWERIKGVGKQEFMTMIGHDDLFGPGFLEAISALIGRHPDAALYLTGARLIGADGKKIRACKPVSGREDCADYLRARFAFERDVFGTGYVMRSADYERVGGIPPFERLSFADDALWLSLMRNSYKVCDPAEHFAVRIHPRSESASLPSVWPYLIKGLTQFSEFLRAFADGQSELSALLRAQGEQFFLTYHRNAAVFALVEASMSGHLISRDALAKIEASAAQCAPSVAGRFWRSPKLIALRILNASPARRLVRILWTAYGFYKSRTQ